MRGRGALPAALLLVLRLCAAPCPFPTPGEWLAHCAYADDCTSEQPFCACCKAHRAERTPYTEACQAICATELDAKDEPEPKERAPGASTVGALDTARCHCECHGEGWNVFDGAAQGDNSCQEDNPDAGFGLNDVCCSAWDRQPRPATWMEPCCGVKARSAAPRREGFEFVEFGDIAGSQDPRDAGPHFDEPRLSLVGDAAVVMGECYNYHIKSRMQEDGSMQSCLMQPTPVPLFADDRTPAIHNLSLCGASKAPFHLEDPATDLINLLCFHECAKRNTTQPHVPPVRPNTDKLFIASCTQKCFPRCVQPLAANCSVSCPEDAGVQTFYCLKECHANTTVCALPEGPRDVRAFRANPNEQVCYNVQEPYVSCVDDCHQECHAALNQSKRVVQDDVDDWYVQECERGTKLGTTEAGECVTACMGNCSEQCTERGHQIATQESESRVWTDSLRDDERPSLLWFGEPGEAVAAGKSNAPGYGESLASCAHNCSQFCSETCTKGEAKFAYSRQCRPPVLPNCTALCFSEVCPLQSSFCAVYDLDGRPRALDLNCTLSNVSFTGGGELFNASSRRGIGEALETPTSPLSTLAKVNSTVDVCYNDCFQINASARSVDTGEPYYFCNTTCYKKVCMESCQANCTREEAIANLPPCPMGREPGECMGPDCPGNRFNCSWERAVEKQYQESLINLTAVLAGEKGLHDLNWRDGTLVFRKATPEDRADLWVPSWGDSECEGIVDDVLSKLQDCLWPACRTMCTARCLEWPVVTFQTQMSGELGVPFAQALYKQALALLLGSIEVSDITLSLTDFSSSTSSRTIVDATIRASGSTRTAAMEVLNSYLDRVDDDGFVSASASSMQRLTSDLAMGVAVIDIRAPVEGFIAWRNYTEPAPRVNGRLVNDTSGICTQDCHVECAADCVALTQSMGACDIPGPQETPCYPPKECTDDCALSCFDPTYLIEHHGNDFGCNGSTTFGENSTVVSIPYEYNLTHNPICGANVTITRFDEGTDEYNSALVDKCPREFTYYNVTQKAGNILFRPHCIQYCYGNCTERCVDRYCVTQHRW